MVIITRKSNEQNKSKTIAKQPNGLIRKSTRNSLRNANKKPERESLTSENASAAEEDDAMDEAKAVEQNTSTNTTDSTSKQNGDAEPSSVQTRVKCRKLNIRKFRGRNRRKAVQPKKRKLVPRTRKQITLEERYNAILNIENNVKTALEISQELGCGRSTVKMWLAEKEKKKIIEHYKSAISFKNKKKILPFKYEKLNDALFEWFKAEKAAKKFVKGSMLKNKAKEMSAELGYEGFVPHCDWFRRFRIRYNVVMRNIKIGYVIDKVAARHGKENAECEEEDDDEEELPPPPPEKVDRRKKLDKKVKVINPNAKKRKPITLEDRYLAIQDIVLKKTKTPEQVSAELGCGKNTVLMWLVDDEKKKIIENYRKSKLSRTKFLIRPCKYNEINKALFEWFKKERSFKHVKNTTGTSTKRVLDGPELMRKAKEIANSLGHTNFQASNGWFRIFRHRYSLILKDKKVGYVIDEKAINNMNSNVIDELELLQVSQTVPNASNEPNSENMMLNQTHQVLDDMSSSNGATQQSHQRIQMLQRSQQEQSPDPNAFSLPTLPPLTSSAPITSKNVLDCISILRMYQPAINMSNRELTLQRVHEELNEIEKLIVNDTSQLNHYTIHNIQQTSAQQTITSEPQIMVAFSPPQLYLNITDEFTPF